MPTIYRQGPYRFFFYSNENDEPPHVHVKNGSGGEAKFWLEPILLQSAKGFGKGELTSVQAIIEERKESFLEAWNEYFSF
ncbi:MAG: DUF4160 domain-containing protein [Gemmataceae bacterium]|nr:DUF4160 domain-containing protein [Gemmataceae bacterium]